MGDCYLAGEEVRKNTDCSKLLIEPLYILVNFLMNYQVDLV